MFFKIRSTASILLIVAFHILSPNNVYAQNSSAPKAKQGTMDLSNWDFHGEKTLPLTGEWKFFWNRFIIPNDIDPKNNATGFIFTNAPSVWNGTSFDGESIGSHGFASYELTILLPDNIINPALSIPDEGTAYNLYVNGKLIANAGTVGDKVESSRALYKPQIVILPDSKNLHLVLHVSNFQNRWGGYWFPIRLGSLKDVLSEAQTKKGISFAVCIAAVLMAGFNLVFFLFRRKDLAPLFFATHCVLILIRGLTTGERLGHLMFPNVPWEILNRLEYISVYLSAPALYAFLHRFCYTKFWEKYGLLFDVPYFVTALIVAVFPNQIYTLTLNPISIYGFFVTIPGWSILLLYGIHKKYEGAWILFLGYIVIMFCTFHDIAHNMGFLHTSTYVLPYGQLAMIASHAILISKRFSNSLIRSENLSHKMKSLVSSTREIMTSASFNSAAQTTLKILSKNVEEMNRRNSSLNFDLHSKNGKSDSFLTKNQGLNIYLPEANSSLWKRFSLDQDDNLLVEDIDRFISKESLEIDLKALYSPEVFGESLLLPVQNSKASFAVLDLPIGNFLDSDSEMDWVQGIAYALALSIQNVIRQDREKLAIIGELSAEIAHDIGHHVILIQKVLRSLNTSHNEKKDFDLARAKKETEALANLSLDILEFSKKVIILDFKEVDIGEFFQGIQEDLELFFEGSGIRFYCEINAKGTVRLDPLRIQRLILNLAKNSLEAIGDRGNFFLRVEKEGPILYIVFKDDGPGLSEEFKTGFYNSMVETKKPFGSGLGLSIVRKIALAHGGEVLIDSSPGKGSRFTVLLPC
ncbi:histidine kinase [Leptospira barantonii]|uniref:histidine kinase n=1 Tax=Leptospira barantonii TaxID=2023184 RepID=A0A5F2BNU1_9LEPT|nr:sensor histidine kinase [Leptospira barantonii]TGM07172.1 histidine kinase [Leptospira barantonii]